MSKEILTAQEVAKYLRIHLYTVKRLARAGKLPGFKIGGQWRFHQNEINQCFQSEKRAKKESK